MSVAEIDAALRGLAAHERTTAAAAVLAQLALPGLSLDEDDIAAVTRRGLLLAAAAGDPSAVEPASAAVLETAAELGDLDVAEPLAASLHRIAEDAARDGHEAAAAAASELAADRDLALEALALVLLVMAGEG